MKAVAGLGIADIPAAEGVASWYMPGLMDGFGDRLLMFDNTDNHPLELLRFHAALVDIPGFEEVLQDCVYQFGRLTHAAFPAIRAVERLETDGSLVLVSTYQPGRRLSALFAEPRPGNGLHPAFVTWIVGQVIQPLSVLQAQGEGCAHSAVTADRIILTPDGRVRVVEHVLGSALRHLARSPAGLWRDFGLLAPIDRSGLHRLDARTDVFQVGILALSMLLARRVTLTDAAQRLPALLDQWSNGGGSRSRVFGDSLRLWLERALQISDRSYRSAAEAYADLRELPSSRSRGFEFLQAGDINAFATPLLAVRSAVQTNGREAHMAEQVAVNEVHVTHSIPLTGEQGAQDNNGLSAGADVVPIGLKARSSSRSPSTAEPEPAGRDVSSSARWSSRPRWSWNARSVIAAGVGAVVIGQAVVIAIMFLRDSSAAAMPPVPVRPGSAQTRDTVGSPGLAAGSAALTTPGASVHNAATLIDAARDLERKNAEALAAVFTQAASNQRSGGVRLTAPIELKVIQGDRVLGSSSDGPIVTTAGTHDLDLINTSLGFRTRRSVTFRAGEITALTIPVPPGRISLNAAPWAEVWIDNRLVGETPLANLEIPIGEHEVVFRNPDLGERRQNVIVRADAVARASATFDR